MAHYVTCSICKKRFDRDKYPATQITPRRYAHALCAGTLSEEQAKNEQDRIDLENYIIKLFNLENMDGRITLQLKKLFEKYPYMTYSGILKTLVYFYEINHNSIENSKVNGVYTLGIVPWVYDEAKQYYYQQYLNQEKNKNKNIENYIPKIKEVTIQPPKKEMKKKKIFTFLDEEVLK